jgi:hypothetical protein
MNKYFGQFIVLGLIIISGCGGTFRPHADATKQADPRAGASKDKYLPLDQPEDFVIIPSAVSIFPSNDTSLAGSKDGTLTPAADNTSDQAVAQAFRIQLFTSKEYGPAFREKTIAVEVFNQPVIMDYEVPYYKVRVGNFATREEAEKYLPMAREAGYKTAWVVKAYVNIRALEDVYDGLKEEISRPAADSAAPMKIKTDSDQ